MRVRLFIVWLRVLAALSNWPIRRPGEGPIPGVECTLKRFALRQSATWERSGEGHDDHKAWVISSLTHDQGTVLRNSASVLSELISRVHYLLWNP